MNEESSDFGRESVNAPPLRVEADLDLHALAVDGMAYRVPRRVAAVLRWDPRDPWAVELDFAHGPLWVVGWELVADAARLPRRRRHIGDGDVRIARPNPRLVVITLASPDGSVTLVADARDLAAFVEAVAPRHRLVADRPWIPDTAAELLAAI